jgi:hypothetical protein
MVGQIIELPQAIAAEIVIPKKLKSMCPKGNGISLDLGKMGM